MEWDMKGNPYAKSQSEATKCIAMANFANRLEPQAPGPSLSLALPSGASWGLTGVVLSNITTLQRKDKKTKLVGAETNLC